MRLAFFVSKLSPTTFINLVYDLGMSFIQDTLKCASCGNEINVSTGTFGSGIPEKCDVCSQPNPWKFLSAGWNAKN